MTHELLDFGFRRGGRRRDPQHRRHSYYRVRIRDSSFLWKQQGSLPPDCLDEQPSRRGVYPYAVPLAYIRWGEELSLRENVEYRIDESMKAHIRDTFVTEN